MSNALQDKSVRIGEVYLMRFDGIDSEQHGVRPGLVFQNNLGNLHSPNVIALPLTSSIKKQNQPTHVFLPASETGLRMDSMVLCECPQSMSKGRIIEYITTLPDEYMSKVAIASLLSSAIISFIDPNDLFSIWEKAVALNAA